MKDVFVVSGNSFDDVREELRSEEFVVWTEQRTADCDTDVISLLSDMLGPP